MSDVEQVMLALGRDAKAAAPLLATAPESKRNMALRESASTLRERSAAVIEANAADVAAAKEKGLSAAMVDRLVLDEKRVEAIAKGLESIADLADPIGKIETSWDMPGDSTGAVHNPGLAFERVRVPLGLIGVIYESRPNVTADAAGLCIKSGNAVILRGGSESKHSSTAIHACVVEGLRKAGIDHRCVGLVPTTDRAAVGHMLTGLGGAIDVIIPRGGKSLVDRVQREARVPVFSHLEGICHTYIDASADIEAAVAVVTNAKLRRTGICGATETVLVDRAALGTHLAPVLASLTSGGCELRCDAEVTAAAASGGEPTSSIALVPATEEDWSTEYLSPVVSIAAVDGVEGAIAHIARYSSNHTESIIATDKAAVGRFFAGVDSAIVLHNASTQFADGGEFGFGAEIGIATGKLHARGPVGVDQLTTFKYLVRSKGDYSLRK